MFVEDVCYHVILNNLLWRSVNVGHISLLHLFCTRFVGMKFQVVFWTRSIGFIVRATVVYLVYSTSDILGPLFSRSHNDNSPFPKQFIYIYLAYNSNLRYHWVIHRPLASPALYLNLHCYFEMILNWLCPQDLRFSYLSETKKHISTAVRSTNNNDYCLNYRWLLTDIPRITM